jgi:hypothetical protein
MFKVRPNGTTFGDSDRPVEPIHLPDNLDVNRIMTDCWKMGKKEYKDLKGSHAMKLFAATVNNLPRLMEFTREFILDKRGKKTPINQQYMSDLIAHVSKRTKQRYSKAHFDSLKIIVAIIFRDYKISLDEEVMEAVSNSVLTNRVSLCQDYKVIPTSNLFMLRVAAEYSDTITMASELNKCFDKIFKCIETAPTNQEGDLLEVVYREWLLVRLEAARQAAVEGIHTGTGGKGANKRKGISMARILGLGDKLKGLPIDLKQPAFTRKVDKDKPIELVPLANTSYENKSLYRAQLKNIAVIDPVSRPVVVIIPKAGEAWDVGVKMMSSSSSEPLYIFIDNKSRLENATEINSTTVKAMPKGGRQYKKTKKVIGDRLKFVYIYATMIDKPSYCVDNAIFMGRNESIKMMGPLAELCRVDRSFPIRVT